jgi:hypothetical protein
VACLAAMLLMVCDMDAIGGKAYPVYVFKHC